MSCVRACMCVWERENLPPTAVHVWDGAFRPGQIFPLHLQWWRPRAEGRCRVDATFFVVRLGSRCPSWLPSRLAWVACWGSTLGHHHCIWTVSDFVFLHHHPPTPPPVLCPLFVPLCGNIWPLRGWSVHPPAFPTPTSPWSHDVRAVCPCTGT